jgi:hypothetical protein
MRSGRFRDASGWLLAVKYLWDPWIEVNRENGKCDLIENGWFSPAWSLLGLILDLVDGKVTADRCVKVHKIIHKIIYIIILQENLFYTGREVRRTVRNFDQMKYVLSNKFIRTQRGIAPIVCLRIESIDWLKTKAFQSLSLLFCRHQERILRASKEWPDTLTERVHWRIITIT